MRGLIPILLGGLMVGCAAGRPTAPPAVPLLQLAPAELGRELALQQRLTFVRDERREQIDALLEVDGNEVRLLLHQAGQSALRLHWDGQVLTESRADWLPDELNAARVLSDLQLVHWPLAAIQSQLPAGWRVTEGNGNRLLRAGDELVARVDYPQTHRQRLTQYRYGYVLEIASVEVAP